MPVYEISMMTFSETLGFPGQLGCFSQNTRGTWDWAEKTSLALFLCGWHRSMFTRLELPSFSVLHAHPCRHQFLVSFSSPCTQSNQDSDPRQAIEQVISGTIREQDWAKGEVKPQCRSNETLAYVARSSEVIGISCNRPQWQGLYTLTSLSYWMYSVLGTHPSLL